MKHSLETIRTALRDAGTVTGAAKLIGITRGNINYHRRSSPEYFKDIIIQHGPPRVGLERVKEALIAAGNDKEKAATILGSSLATVYLYIKNNPEYLSEFAHKVENARASLKKVKEAMIRRHGSQAAAAKELGVSKQCVNLIVWANPLDFRDIVRGADFRCPKEHIKDVLDYCGKNKAWAAEIFRIGVPTLIRRMNENVNYFKEYSGPRSKISSDRLLFVLNANHGNQRRAAKNLEVASQTISYLIKRYNIKIDKKITPSAWII